jgi:hypothetical protein
MSYESAVPVECTLLLVEVIGVTAPDTRSVRLGGRAARDICTLAELPRCCVKPKAAACAWNAGRDPHRDVSEDRHSGPTVAADVQKRI